MTETPTPAVDTTSVAADQLKSYVERIEFQEAEIAAATEGRKDIYSEAKSSGFDIKALRKIVALRKQDAAERQEADAILETYLAALGMA